MGGNQYFLAEVRKILELDISLILEEPIVKCDRTNCRNSVAE